MPATLAVLVDANVSFIARIGARLVKISNPKTKTSVRAHKATPTPDGT